MSGRAAAAPVLVTPVFLVLLALGLLSLGLASCGGARPAGLPAWQPEGSLDCRADLAMKEVGLGQPFILTLRVQHPEAARLDVADRAFQGFAVESAARVEPAGEGFLHTITYTLRPTDLGTLKIPPFELAHGDAKATTAELEVAVRPALGAKDDPVQLEAQAAFEPQVVWWPWVVGLLVAAAAGWLIVWFARRPRRGPPLPVEVALPPHVKALRALSRLRQAWPVTEPEVDAFYVGVSQVLRVYLEERFGLHAPARSTEEFLAELERGEALRTEHRHRLRNFLQQCDLVKFARLHPDIEVHEQTLRIAETFVEETRADVDRAAPVAAAGGAT